MNECWINVYESGLGLSHNSKAMAENCKSLFRPTLYRIHVKMKPIKLADIGRDYEWVK